jgi:hypothetical protein
VRQGKGNVPDFEGVAAEMLPWYPGVAVLGLSPGGVIRRVAPLEGNEKSIGFNQLTDPKQGREARMARDTGKLTLAGPLKLVQGGLGAVGRLPIFIDGADGKPVFWGLTYAVLRFPEALSNVRLNQLSANGVAYSLWRINPDMGVRETIAGSQTLPQAAADNTAHHTSEGRRGGGEDAETSWMLRPGIRRRRQPARWRVSTVSRYCKWRAKRK